MTAPAYLPRAFQLAFPRSLAPENRLVLVLSGLDLEGYFDESGLHDGSQAASLAGYISSAAQWEQFEIEWRECLRDWGLEYFHMTDFSVGAKPYDLWTLEERRSRFARLTDIIFKHVLATVGCVVLKPRYDAIMSDHAKRVTGGPYGLLAAACFMETGNLLTPEFPSMRIAYVYEDGARGKGQVLKIYNVNKKDPEQTAKMKLLSLRFEDKKEFLPLQAADILAYELYQHLPRQEGIEPRRPRLEHLTMLARVQRRGWFTLDDDELTKWAAILVHAKEDFSDDE